MEASTNGIHPANRSNKNTISPLNRQSTRYSAHGIHEYRGKFNPQIVRVISNLLNLQQGDWIFDPFCGSGTTLLEASHSGLNAIGIDANPLAIQIAKAKIASITVDLVELNNQVEELERNLMRRIRDKYFITPFNKTEIDQICGESWQQFVPSLDYMQSWFPESVLVQLSVILHEIEKLPSEDVQLILRIILSDILREVSNQEPFDLRIRRRKKPLENAPVIPIYLKNLKDKVNKILKARRYVCDISTTQDAILGDARFCSSIMEARFESTYNDKFDASITSPPYATALPYIDTQRLSLVLLGLISSKEIRNTERSLIGNREISPKERIRIENDMDNNIANLPSECLALCNELRAAVDKSSDGFRRQNVPALVYKYLDDMSLMFKQVNGFLKMDSPFALVVGRNETKLGGNKFFIDTPNYLIQLAEYNDFKLQDKIELNTYRRFDIHQNNSIKSESLIILRSR